MKFLHTYIGAVACCEYRINVCDLLTIFTSSIAYSAKHQYLSYSGSSGVKFGMEEWTYQISLQSVQR